MFSICLNVSSVFPVAQVFSIRLKYRSANINRDQDIKRIIYKISYKLRCYIKQNNYDFPRV